MSAGGGAMSVMSAWMMIWTASADLGAVTGQPFELVVAQYLHPGGTGPGCGTEFEERPGEYDEGVGVAVPGLRRRRIRPPTPPPTLPRCHIAALAAAIAWSTMTSSSVVRDTDSR